MPVIGSHRPLLTQILSSLRSGTPITESSSPSLNIAAALRRASADKKFVISLVYNPLDPFDSESLRRGFAALQTSASVKNLCEFVALPIGGYIPLFNNMIACMPLPCATDSVPPAVVAFDSKGVYQSNCAPYTPTRELLRLEEFTVQFAEAHKNEALMGQLEARYQLRCTSMLDSMRRYLQTSRAATPAEKRSLLEDDRFVRDTLTLFESMISDSYTHYGSLGSGACDLAPAVLHGLSYCQSLSVLPCAESVPRRKSLAFLPYTALIEAVGAGNMVSVVDGTVSSEGTSWASPSSAVTETRHAAHLVMAAAQLGLVGVDVFTGRLGHHRADFTYAIPLEPAASTTSLMMADRIRFDSFSLPFRSVEAPETLFRDAVQRLMKGEREATGDAAIPLEGHDDIDASDHSFAGPRCLAETVDVLVRHFSCLPERRRETLCQFLDRDASVGLNTLASIRRVAGSLLDSIDRTTGLPCSGRCVVSALDVKALAENQLNSANGKPGADMPINTVMENVSRLAHVDLAAAVASVEYSDAMDDLSSYAAAEYCSDEDATEAFQTVFLNHTRPKWRDCSNQVLAKAALEPYPYIARSADLPGEKIQRVAPPVGSAVLAHSVLLGLRGSRGLGKHRQKLWYAGAVQAGVICDFVGALASCGPAFTVPAIRSLTSFLVSHLSVPCHGTKPSHFPIDDWKCSLMSDAYQPPQKPNAAPEAAAFATKIFSPSSYLKYESPLELPCHFSFDEAWISLSLLRIAAAIPELSSMLPADDNPGDADTLDCISNLLSDALLPWIKGSKCAPMAQSDRSPGYLAHPLFLSDNSTVNSALAAIDWPDSTKLINCATALVVSLIRQVGDPYRFVGGNEAVSFSNEEFCDPHSKLSLQSFWFRAGTGLALGTIESSIATAALEAALLLGSQFSLASPLRVELEEFCVRTGSFLLGNLQGSALGNGTTEAFRGSPAAVHFFSLVPSLVAIAKRQRKSEVHTHRILILAAPPVWINGSHADCHHSSVPPSPSCSRSASPSSQSEPQVFSAQSDPAPTGPPLHTSDKPLREGPVGARSFPSPRAVPNGPTVTKCTTYRPTARRTLPAPPQAAASSTKMSTASSESSERRAHVPGRRVVPPSWRAAVGDRAVVGSLGERSLAGSAAVRPLPKRAGAPPAASRSLSAPGVPVASGDLAAGVPRSAQGPRIRQFDAVQQHKGRLAVAAARRSASAVEVAKTLTVSHSSTVTSPREMVGTVTVASLANPSSPAKVVTAYNSPRVEVSHRSEVMPPDRIHAAVLAATRRSAERKRSFSFGSACSSSCDSGTAAGRASIGKPATVSRLLYRSGSAGGAAPLGPLGSRTVVPPPCSNRLAQLAQSKQRPVATHTCAAPQVKEDPRVSRVPLSTAAPRLRHVVDSQGATGRHGDPALKVTARGPTWRETNVSAVPKVSPRPSVLSVAPVAIISSTGYNTGAVAPPRPVQRLCSRRSGSTGGASRGSATDTLSGPLQRRRVSSTGRITTVSHASATVKPTRPSDLAATNVSVVVEDAPASFRAEPISPSHSPEKTAQSQEGEPEISGDTSFARETISPLRSTPTSRVQVSPRSVGSTPWSSAKPASRLASTGASRSWELRQIASRLNFDSPTRRGDRSAPQQSSDAGVTMMLAALSRFSTKLERMVTALGLSESDRSESTSPQLRAVGVSKSNTLLGRVNAELPDQSEPRSVAPLPGVYSEHRSDGPAFISLRPSPPAVVVDADETVRTPSPAFFHSESDADSADPPFVHTTHFADKRDAAVSVEPHPSDPDVSVVPGSPYEPNSHVLSSSVRLSWSTTSSERRALPLPPSLFADPYTLADRSFEGEYPEPPCDSRSPPAKFVRSKASSDRAPDLLSASNASLSVQELLEMVKNQQVEIDRLKALHTTSSS